jgi:hypothetical protein
MQTKTSAKDFFLQLGIMVSLYVGAVALLNLLFRIINVAYPQIEKQYFGPSISFPVATLIVVFPLFLFLANIINKGYVSDPSKKEYAVRKWLIYITLFIAGAVIAGDLVTLIFFFLDGRELTVGFLLKVLAIILVAGSIFGYYIDDLREKLTKERRNIWRIVSAIIVLGSIVAGFAIIGSPRVQRLARYDEIKINDLQNIQNQIIYYWQTKEALPQDLENMRDSLSYYSLPLDSQTNRSYEYEKTGDLSFSICAEFNLKSSDISERIRIGSAYNYIGFENENWVHKAGRFCFERTIDPDRYPPLSKPIR